MTEVRQPNPQQLGPYTVVDFVARGATSEVARAFDADSRRTVAIKILSRDFLKEPSALARFEQESRALTELNHPNVARVYATGIAADGRPYLVMEFVNGFSLLDLILDKVEMSASQQLDLIIQATEGFQAAFNRNIIHCDIKPANLMVETPALTGKQGDRATTGIPVSAKRRVPFRTIPEGCELRLKIVDFGLAKIVREDAAVNFAKGLMGTPRYMAPEVAMGRPADHRSDIYSLGATFHHLLTGRPPFDGDTPSAVMAQHISAPLTPPYLYDPTIPPDISEIVERAMAKEPGHRHADYDELLSDLKAAQVALLAKERRLFAQKSIEGETAPAEAATASDAKTTVLPSRATVAAGKRFRWLLAFVAVLVLATFAGIVYLRQSKARSESRQLLPALVQRLLTFLGQERPGENSHNRKPGPPPAPELP